MADENTVMVKAVRSFAGEEGDKWPGSSPFPVSRQRYADLKANDLVEHVEDEPVAKKAAEPPSAKLKK